MVVTMETSMFFGIGCLAEELHYKQRKEIVAPATMAALILLQSALLGYLLAYHFRLILKNRTTYEELKGMHKEFPTNPYNISSNNKVKYLANVLKAKHLIGPLPRKLEQTYIKPKSTQIGVLIQDNNSILEMSSLEAKREMKDHSASNEKTLLEANSDILSI